MQNHKPQEILDFEAQVKHTLEWSVGIDPGVKDVLAHLMAHVSTLAQKLQAQE